MRSIRGKRWLSRRSTLVATAIVVAAFAGVLVAIAQAAQMAPPVMTPGPAATIDVSWEIVAPIGANDTTYTLSWDTTLPFTATQTVTTINTSAVIAGVDGVTYYAIVQADEGSGLSDPSAVNQDTADGRAPVSTFVTVPASPNGANGWFTSVTSAGMSIEETNTGLQSFTVNGVDVSADLAMNIPLPPDPSTYTTAPVEGVNEYSFFGTDVAGNVESPEVTAAVSLDSVSPTCAIAVSSNGPTRQTITATITAGDASPGSGFDHIDLVFLARGTSPSGGTVWKSAAGSSVTTTAPEGRLTLFARSFDVAGNVSGVQQADVFYDTTAPATTMVTVPASPTGPGGSWLHAPGITLNVVDADPSTTTYYSWNTTNTVATAGNTPVVPTGAGVKTLRYLSVDTAGNRETTHTATFNVLDQQTFTITPSAGSHGSISPATPQVVAGGSNLAFTITPDPGYYVANVIVDTNSVGAVTHYDFNGIVADHAISATFTSVPPSTITPSAGAHGSITPSTPQDVGFGLDATFTIAPDAGYRIANVLVDSVSVGPVTSYTFHDVTSDHTISASFAILTYTLAPSAGAHGSISPPTTQTVDFGSDTTFTITPDSGYHVQDVLVDGVSVGAVASYTFSDVQANHTISATFATSLRATSLSIVANHSSVRRRQRVYFHGIMKPNMPNGTHVGFYVRKSTSSTWHLVSVRHIFGSHHWNYYYHPGSAHGTYYIRVRYVGNSAFAACTSRTIKVVWR